MAVSILLVLLASVPLADPPAAHGAMAPSLVTADDGALWITWVEGDTVRTASASRERWSAPTTIVTSPKLFANWADVPSLALNGSAQLAHFPEKSAPAKYAYDVELAWRDGRGVFVRRGAAHDDGTPTEHGFASVVPERAGFLAFWLDGRRMAKKGPMTLRAGRVVDGRVHRSSVIDARVCECCRTAAAVTSEGPFVVYRDRDEDEVRNIGIVRRTRRGFTKPRVVHDDGWKTPGCPVNGPAADASDRRAVVAWYTGAELGRVRVAFSRDAGATFRMHEAHDHPDAVPLGRVDVVLAEEGGAHVSWVVADDDKRARIVVRHVSERGALGPPRTVATTTPSRASGFPKMVRRPDGRLYVAWTEVRPDGSTRVRGRTMPTAARSSSRPASSRPPPISSYVAQTLDGRPASVDALRGRPVLLNIWATWCGPCRREMPDLEMIAKRYPSLQVIGVSVDEQGADDRVKDVVRRLGVTYPIWRDPADRASVVFRATSLPTTILLDAEGRIVRRADGMFAPDDESWSSVLRSVAAPER